MSQLSCVLNENEQWVLAIIDEPGYDRMPSGCRTNLPGVTSLDVHIKLDPRFSTNIEFNRIEST